MTSDDHLMYGTMPVGRLFRRIALPGAIASLVWAVCSITDGIFVGQFLGGEALAAMNLAFPVIMVLGAISDLIASGSSVRISMHLGRGDEESARRLFTWAIILIEMISVAFLIVGVLFSEQIIILMGADAELASLAAEYLIIPAIAAPLFLLFFATDNYLRICGKVRYSMNINVLAAVLNIVLDALFIGVMGWGLWSAALATVLSLCISAALSLIPFLTKSVTLRFVRCSPQKDELIGSVSNGMPTFFTSVSGSLYMMFANVLLLNTAGAMAVSALSIMMYVNTVAGALFSGMAASIQPAVSYNHGAGDGRRCWDMGVVLMRTCAVLGLVTCVVIGIFNEQAVSVFVSGEPELEAMAAAGTAIFALTFLTNWAAICVNQILISLGLVRPSLTIGVLSQLVIPVAAMAAMSFWGLNGIWWSFVAAAVISAIVSIVALVRARDRGAFPGLGPLTS